MYEAYRFIRGALSTFLIVILHVQLTVEQDKLKAMKKHLNISSAEVS